VIPSENVRNGWKADIPTSAGRRRPKLTAKQELKPEKPE
jgi:hypothetical protein